ncbi:DNA-directed RNA polymerase sigma-70 factor [Acrocarpospora corrugata]|uniref:RNA polymerase sigma factor n=1 Tax=Acrocarpospora corrugata TaxID=35763 RepID=A0A5M3VUC1_9ACTN|nr:DNA-directed RNA polymerase sigma-70 factor [Acrocarpospora corrugata]
MDEPVGFREFVAERIDRLTRVAFLLTGDHHLAEDLVQATLIRVWRKWKQASGSRFADAYLNRILVTTYLSWRRRRWWGEIPTSFDDHDVAGVTDGLEQALAADDFRRRLAVLPRHQRAVVVLRYYLDLSERETAELLGCTVGTVKSQNHKALARLRSHISRVPE